MDRSTVAGGSSTPPTGPLTQLGVSIIAGSEITESSITLWLYDHGRVTRKRQLRHRFVVYLLIIPDPTEFLGIQTSSHQTKSGWTASSL